MQEKIEDLEQEHNRFRKMLDEIEELNNKKMNLVNAMLDSQTLDDSTKSHMYKVADYMEEERKHVSEIGDAEEREYKENLRQLEEKQKDDDSCKQVGEEEE